MSQNEKEDRGANRSEESIFFASQMLAQMARRVKIFCYYYFCHRQFLFNYLPIVYDDIAAQLSIHWQQ